MTALAVLEDQAERRTLDEVGRLIATSRSAQSRWCQLPVRRRLQILRRLRRQMANDGLTWAASVTRPFRQSPAETIAAEVLPLADACSYLERTAQATLQPARLSNRQRPFWQRGVQLQVHREPYGVVLIIGTWNYPLLLTGVQALQALVAGNAVIIKPGRDGTASAELLRTQLIAAGLDPELLVVLDETSASARRVVDAGVDKIVLTGSAATGQQVLQQAAATLTSSAMELSGCDPAFVLPSADLQRAAGCITFGLRFNAGASCVAPRRVFVDQTVAEPFHQALREQLGRVQAMPVDGQALSQADALFDDAIARGAHWIVPPVETSEENVSEENNGSRRFAPVALSISDADTQLLVTDLLLPVTSVVTVSSMDEALELNERCPYRLGATVFGSPRAANEMAAKIDAGCVTVNDLLVPTADPRVPLSGRGRSGFGVTRGREGLLEMTQIKTVIHQSARWLPHLDDADSDLTAMLNGYLKAAHGGSWSSWYAGLRAFVRGAWSQSSKSGHKNDTTEPRTPK